MSDVAKRLMERRNTVFEQANELLSKAAEENRNLSGEEESSYQAMNAEIDTLDRNVRSILDGEERAKKATEAFEAVAGRPQERRTQEDQNLGIEMRDWLLKRNPMEEFDVRSNTRLDVGIKETRALSKGTATAGGNTVVSSYAGKFVEYLTNNTTLLQAGVDILQTSGGDPLVFPRITSHPTASLVAEAAVIPFSDPAFGQVTLSAYKMAFLTQASNELLADSSIPIEDYLARRSAIAVANTLDTYLLNGTGSNQPRGLLQDTTLGVTGSTGQGGAPTADNLLALIYSVPAQYRKNAVFLMNDTTVATIRGFKDTTGRYLWQESFQQGQPASILGYPVYTDPNVPAVGLGAKSVVFGDLSTYQVRLAGGVRFERSNDFAFNTDQITFRTVLRGDGALLDVSGAVKHFAGAAS